MRPSRGLATCQPVATPYRTFSSRASSGPWASKRPRSTRRTAVRSPQPKDQAQLLAYIENYVPIKLARVLKRKLEKRNPYWEEPDMHGLPFVIAVQDFHAPLSMQMITSA